MSASSIKRTIGSGLALAIPLMVVVYITIKMIGIFEKLITPLSKKFGMDKLLGELSLTIFAIVILLLLVFILGLLMQFSFIKKFGKSVEEIAFRIFPSLGHLKTVASEKLDLENAANTWKPVLLFYKNKYNPAYIIEEKDDLITLFLIKGNKTDEGELLITRIGEVKMQEITSKELHNYSKQYGKGFLSLVKGSKLFNA